MHSQNEPRTEFRIFLLLQFHCNYRSLSPSLAVRTTISTSAYIVRECDYSNRWTNWRRMRSMGLMGKSVVVQMRFVCVRCLFRINLLLYVSIRSAAMVARINEIFSLSLLVFFHTHTRKAHTHVHRATHAHANHQPGLLKQMHTRISYTLQFHFCRTRI